MPPMRPATTRLRHFVVHYSFAGDRSEVLLLCKWAKQVIGNSPIETLELVEEEYWPHLAGGSYHFNPLIQHLVSKHHETLRALRMSAARTGLRMSKGIFQNCTSLEELQLSAQKELLVRDAIHISPSGVE